MVDLLGCQVEMAKTCVKQEAEYVLALKKNQPLHIRKGERLFIDLDASPPSRRYMFDFAHSFYNSHGHAEKRHCCTIADPEVVPNLRGAQRLAQVAVWCARESRIC